MFKRIVVPLDGTPFAEAALGPARELARAFGSHLLLVRAVGPAGLPRVAARLAREIELERVDTADAYLHEMTDTLRREGFDASIAVYLTEPGAGIAQAAEIGHGDLIVMTAHPRWQEDVLDNRSTTLQVLARTRVPILAWRAHVTTEPRRGQKMSQEQIFLAAAQWPIVVPLDGSPFAESALPVAAALARQFGSYLVLVRAVEGGQQPFSDAYIEPVRERAETPAEREAGQYLTRVQNEVKLRGVGAIARVGVGSAVGAIERARRQNDAGLIVMASHGTTGIASSFLGSVAARMVEEIDVPILIVRPEAGTQATGNRHR